VINPGVDPTLRCYYKSSRLKQYFKEGRALRTETVICDTGDFDIGRRVCAQNWNALRAVGQNANRCLCDAEASDAQPAPDVATFCQVTRPSTTNDGQSSLVDPRSPALDLKQCRTGSVPPSCALPPGPSRTLGAGYG
jgi:hypothetical protein